MYLYTLIAVSSTTYRNATICALVNLGHVLPISRATASLKEVRSLSSSSDAPMAPATLWQTASPFQMASSAAAIGALFGLFLGIYPPPVVEDYWYACTCFFEQRTHDFS